MQNKEEKILLEKLKNDDELAFKNIYFLYYNKLYAFARNFLNDNELAQDIVADVFYKIWKNREILDIKTSLKAYLYTSVKNLCLNKLRTLNKELKIIDDTELKIKEIEINYYTDLLVNEISALELEDMINDFVSKMPEKQKMVFLLSRSEGLSSDEISKNLGISKRTVETHLYNAIKYLKEKLNSLLKER